MKNLAEGVGFEPTKVSLTGPERADKIVARYTGSVSSSSITIATPSK